VQQLNLRCNPTLSQSWRRKSDNWLEQFSVEDCTQPAVGTVFRIR
jgi:hypothetical protein